MKPITRALMSVTDKSGLVEFATFLAGYQVEILSTGGTAKLLRENGVPVQVGNKPIYRTTAFRDETLSLFGAEEVYKAQILLPSHHLMTLDEAAFIIKTFESILEAYGHRGCSF